MRGTGTVLAVFQPAEETAQGAQAMIDDGLFDRFPKPDVILGQHVMPAPAGPDQLPTRARRRPPPTAWRCGSSAAARTARCPSRASTRSSWRPPPSCACRRSCRARSAATQAAVVTVGALQAGTKDNVIPDDALLKINVRSFDEAVRRHVLDAIERIVNAEAAASGAPRPPEITTTEHYPLTVNDPESTRRVAAALRGRFGDDRVHELAEPVSASEDFGSFGTEWGVPSVFWYVGGTDPDLYETRSARRTRRPRRPHQPQPELRPRHPSDARDRRAGHGHRGAGRPGRLTPDQSRAASFSRAATAGIRGCPSMPSMTIAIWSR